MEGHVHFDGFIHIFERASCSTPLKLVRLRYLQPLLLLLQHLAQDLHLLVVDNIILLLENMKILRVGCCGGVGKKRKIDMPTFHLLAKHELCKVLQAAPKFLNPVLCILCYF